MNADPAWRRPWAARLNCVFLPARNHGDHGADRTVRRVDRDDRGGGVARLVERLLDRLLGERLEAPVDRRVDAEPSRAHGVRAVLLDQLLTHEAEEERLLDLRVELPGLELERRRDRLLVARPGDLAGRASPRARRCGALQPRPLPRERVVDRGRLRQAGDHRRLDQRQVPRRLREVRLRGRLDAVGAVAVVDLVHVRLEDLTPSPRLVELEREARLLELALERPLRADGPVEVPDELLRDRRAALDDVARPVVLQRGAHDSLVVDAAVLVEAPVLDCDRCLPQPRRRLLERDGLPVVVRRDRAQKRAVCRVDERVLADSDRLQRGEVAAVLERRPGRQGGGSDRRGGGSEEHHDNGCGDDLLAAAPLAAPPPAASGPHHGAAAPVGGAPVPVPFPGVHRHSL